MTYPQPRTNDQISAGARQWRFLTQVGAINVGAGVQSAGSGEIYEIDSSSTAIAYGPEMDFANILLTYLDPSIGVTNLNSIRLTPQVGFPGALAPRFDTSYPISPSRAGRMLASLGDLWNGQYLPVGFSGAGGDQIFFQKPVIDLIGWQSAPPSLPSKRSDKVFLFESYAITGAGHYWTILPFYDRKYAFVDFLNKSGASIDLEIRGVNLTTVNTDAAVGTAALHEETILLASAAVANGAHSSKVITAAVNGLFDLLAISLNFGGLSPANNAPLRVVVSDT